LVAVDLALETDLSEDADVACTQRYFKANRFSNDNRSALLRHQPFYVSDIWVNYKLRQLAISIFFDCSHAVREPEKKGEYDAALRAFFLCFLSLALTAQAQP